MFFCTPSSRSFNLRTTSRDLSSSQNRVRESLSSCVLASIFFKKCMACFRLDLDPHFTASSCGDLIQGRKTKHCFFSQSILTLDSITRCSSSSRCDLALVFPDLRQSLHLRHLEHRKSIPVPTVSSSSHFRSAFFSFCHCLASTLVIPSSASSRRSSSFHPSHWHPCSSLHSSLGCTMVSSSWSGSFASPERLTIFSVYTTVLNSVFTEDSLFINFSSSKSGIMLFRYFTLSATLSKYTPSLDVVSDLSIPKE